MTDIENIEISLKNALESQNYIKEQIKLLEDALKITNMRIADLENELNPRNLGEVVEKNLRK
jgi:hypothetical protein